MTDPKPVLYDYWRSSASFRVRIALGLKAVRYETVPVNLLEQAHRSPEHIARNPQGLVPALEIDGRMLTQSLAIIEYLDETRPIPPLLPADPSGRARVRAIAHAIAMDIHPVCNMSVAAAVVELAGGGEETRAAWMRRHIGSGLAAVERLLDDAATGSFCHGDRPGLADCCLVPQLYNAERWGVDTTPFPAIRAVAAACSHVPAFADAFPGGPEAARLWHGAMGNLP